MYGHLCMRGTPWFSPLSLHPLPPSTLRRPLHLPSPLPLPPFPQDAGNLLCCLLSQHVLHLTLCPIPCSSLPTGSHHALVCGQLAAGDTRAVPLSVPLMCLPPISCYTLLRCLPRAGAWAAPVATPQPYFPPSCQTLELISAARCQLPPLLATGLCMGGNSVDTSTLPLIPPNARTDIRRVLATPWAGIEFGTPPSIHPSPAPFVCHSLFQGAGNSLGWSPGTCAWVAAVVAAACALVAGAVLMPLLRLRFSRFLERQ